MFIHPQWLPITRRWCMSMKYYVYISDTKVDMLYSQIPQNILRKIAAELNINLGIFSLSVKGKENQEKTRYEKLKIVVNYIEKHIGVRTNRPPQKTHNLAMYE
jgi:hypothetical protein